MPETVFVFLLILKNTSPLKQTSTICLIKWTLMQVTCLMISPYLQLAFAAIFFFFPPVYFSLHASAFSVFWDSGIYIRR